MILRFFILSLVACLLSACGVVPGAGPSASRIENSAEVDGDFKYMLVELDRDVTSVLGRFASKALAERFYSKHTHSHAQRIGVGDVLDVTIFEAGPNGLFSTTDGRSANFPAVRVSQKGQISLPYVGVITVDGDTPLRVQNKILARLRGQAIEPQALVVIKDNQSNAVVVGGDVRQPGKYPLQFGETTLLDAITLAGGASAPVRETFVTFIRGKTKGRQLLHTIIDAKGENIKVNPGDRIVLRHEPMAVSVLGAVNAPGNYPLTSTRTTLLQSVAAARGFSDERANRKGMFVFRFEPRHVAEQIGTIPANITTKNVPVVYRIRLQDPEVFFAAREFIVQDKDTLFVANSQFVDLRKVLGVASTVLSPAITSTNFASSLAN